MTRIGAGILLGVLGAVASIGACALDESGSASDGGATLDASVDVGIDSGADVLQDVTYDIADLGVFETESGAPCTCVPAIPSGYTVVEYVPDQRPGCSTGYGTSADYVENPVAQPSTCSCTCGATPQSILCGCGANPATFNISSGNGSCTDVTNETVVANVGSCYTTAQQLQPNGNKLNDMLAVPATACTPFGSCNGPTKVATIPPASSEQGRACKLSAATSTCTGGTCIPTQGTPFSLCVTDFTQQACPGDFPMPHIAGTSVTDNRACGPSACSQCALVDAGTCGVPQLTLYSGDNNCGKNGSSVVIPADNATCMSAGYGNGTTFDSARYTISQSGGACGYAQGAFGPTGGLGVAGPIRVCCR